MVSLCVPKTSCGSRKFNPRDSRGEAELAHHPMRCLRCPPRMRRQLLRQRPDNLFETYHRRIRFRKSTVTRLPASFPIAARTSAFIGSMCLPSPMAMNELRNGWPSIVPRTFTRPRVPKNATDSGQITYVQPPLPGCFCNMALNRLFNMRRLYQACLFSFPALTRNDRR